MSLSIAEGQIWRDVETGKDHRVVDFFNLKSTNPRNPPTVTMAPLDGGKEKNISLDSLYLNGHFVKV